MEESIAPVEADSAVEILTDDTPETTVEEVGNGAEDATEDAETESDVDDPATDDVEGEPEKADPKDEEGSDDNKEPEKADLAPLGWDEDSKKLYAELPRELRQRMKRDYEQREAFVGRLKNEIGTERQTLKAAQQQMEARIERLDTFKTELDSKIEYYEKVDWVHEFQTAEDPKTVMAHQAQFEALKRQREDATKAKSEAEQESLRTHTQEHMAILQEKMPEIVNAKTFEDMTKYALESGYDEDTLQWASSTDLITLHKAMQYDKLMAKAKAAPKPKPVGSQQKRQGVKPSPATATSPQSSRLKQLNSKRDLSQAEFLELRRLKRR